MKEFAFNLKSHNGRAPTLQRVSATFQPAGVLEPHQMERGDRIVFVAGFGTRAQVLIARKTCKSAKAAHLYRGKSGQPRMQLDGMPLLEREIQWISWDAGFGTTSALFADIEKRFGLPFNGTLLRW